jgi:hypothetical protein
MPKQSGFCRPQSVAPQPPVSDLNRIEIQINWSPGAPQKIKIKQRHIVMAIRAGGIRLTLDGRPGHDPQPTSAAQAPMLFASRPERQTI